MLAQRELGKSLYKWLTKSRADDSKAREERMRIAFCLIAYTGYFEALQKIAPEISKHIEIPRTENLRLEAAAESCTKSEESSVQEVSDGLEVSISMPHPAETLDQIAARILPIYSELTKGLLRLFHSTDNWALLSDKARKEIAASCEQLPRAASDRFRAQYFDLAAHFGEFAIWSNLREHLSTHQQIESLSKAAREFAGELNSRYADIDVGLKQLKNDIQAIPRAITDYTAQTVWRELDRQYTSAIEQPIIKDPAAPETGKPTLAYPARLDIFIPQLFKAIRYSQGMHLEDEETWSSSAVRPDLGEFLNSYLSSPYSTQSPLIVLGHPGSGKSLLSQMLAAQTMSDAYAPIRVELRSINADDEIEAQIEEQISRDIGRSISFSTLMDNLEGRPAVTIFDGYDELLQATGQVFAGYLTKVHKFQERESQTLERNPLRTIVTSRVTLIDKAVIPEGSTVIRLLEFDESRRNKWISVWNKWNASYFNATGVKPFSLPKASKLAPIAEQPLLLLMLALYDSAENALNRATGLDQTVLYESLLRKFIERERTKDSDFAQIKSAAERTVEIDRDMERLGVAAIGMFNRHALHIRATQLNADIDFFQLNRSVPQGSGRQLSQAELLLGSFFFVHQSTAKQRGNAGEDHESDTAFEFLHNTFGEFLVGHFLIGQLLRQTRSLGKLRSDAELIPQRTKILNDRDGLPAIWYACLMHASLFSRPVIVSMITEWFKHAVNLPPKRDVVELLVDFDDVLLNEIQRAITGREFPSVMVGKSTSFESLPLLGCLANYTLNLVTLRVAISEGEFAINEGQFASTDRRPRLWDRLTHLWRSWFSADTLSSLNAIFTAEREGDVVRLKRADSAALPTAGRRIETIVHVALAVGDDTQVALAGALTSDPFRRQSVSLERAKKAAIAENLGIDDEILLRELWTAARSRIDERSRHDLFARCATVIESSRGGDVGRCIDLVRAFGTLGDALRYRELIFRLFRYSNFSLQLDKGGEAISALLELALDVEGRAPFPDIEGLLSENLEDSNVLRIVKSGTPNIAFAVARWRAGRPEIAEDVVTELARRCKDELFLSGLSPYLALNFIRYSTRSQARLIDEVVMAIFGHFLSSQHILENSPDLVADLLEMAQRTRYRGIMSRVCDSLAETLVRRDVEAWHSLEFRASWRHYDHVLIDQTRVSFVLLQAFSRFAKEEAKNLLYKYALQRWFRQGRTRLNVAILRYAREVDDGILLLEFVRAHGRRMSFSAAKRQQGFDVRLFIGRLGIEELSVPAWKDLIWFALSVEDRESAAHLAKIAKSAIYSIVSQPETSDLFAPEESPS